MCLSLSGGTNSYSCAVFSTKLWHAGLKFHNPTFRLAHILALYNCNICSYYIIEMWQYPIFCSIAVSQYHHGDMTVSNDSYFEQKCNFFSRKIMQRWTKRELHFPSTLSQPSPPALPSLPDLVVDRKWWTPGVTKENQVTKFVDVKHFGVPLLRNEREEKVADRQKTVYRNRQWHCWMRHPVVKTRKWRRSLQTNRHADNIQYARPFNY